DVVSGGGTGFEICTVAANCQSGSNGGLVGELNFPVGIATDPTTGGVYVADVSNHRIQKFDSSGNFLRTWGKDVDTGGGTGFEVCTVPANCKAGSNASSTFGGEFDFPVNVATDASGNVYVADNFNDRVQEFGSSGNFIRAWGQNVDSVNVSTGFEICTVAANCQPGMITGLGGSFFGPSGIATDVAGNVYVGDNGNNRMEAFDSS